MGCMCLFDDEITTYDILVSGKTYNIDQVPINSVSPSKESES